MIVYAAPNFERAGVIAGFVLGVGTGLAPSLTKGVLITQGNMHRPDTDPVLADAPASQLTYLWCNATNGFYWRNTRTPETEGDAYIGWVVASADDILAVSHSAVWMPDAEAQQSATQVITMQPAETEVPGPVQPIGGEAFGLVKTEDGINATFAITYNPPATIHVFSGVTAHWVPIGATKEALAVDFDYNGDGGEGTPGRYGTCSFVIPQNIDAAMTGRIYLTSRSRAYKVLLVLYGQSGASPSREVAISKASTPPAAPPALPTSIVGAEVANSRWLETGRNVTHLKIQGTVTLPTAPVTGEWGTFWLVTPRNASTSPLWLGEYPITATPQTIVLEPPQPLDVPDTAEDWTLKVATGKPGAVNSPQDAVSSAAFTITGIGNPAATGITNATATPVYKENQDHTWSWGADLRWTNPTAAAEKYFWIGKVYIKWVDSAGNPDPNYGDPVNHEQEVAENDTAGATVNKTSDRNWPIPPADAVYKTARYTAKIRNRHDVEIVQTTCWGGADHFDITPAQQTGFLTPPGNIGAFTPTYTHLSDRTELRFTVTPPSPVGSYDGIMVYIETGDGTLIADGNTAWDGTRTALGYSAPQLIGKFDTNPVIFSIPLVRESQTLKIKALSYSAAVINDYASAPSAELAITAAAPGKPAAGTAYTENGAYGTVAQYTDTLEGQTKRYFVVSGITLPNDPRFAGWRIVGYGYPADSTQYPLCDLQTGTGATIKIDEPATPFTITLYLQSAGYDADGKTLWNPIVPGITPGWNLAIGTADGTLDLQAAFGFNDVEFEIDLAEGFRVKGVNFGKAFNFDATEFQVAGGVLGIKAVDFRKAMAGTFDANNFDVSGSLFKIGSKGVARTNIADNAIDTPQLNAGAVTTPILTTSVIDIGGAGNQMPIRLRVLDHSKNPIGWIGDDTGGSGYVGGWFKRLLIGGASPADAPFFADVSGNVVAKSVLIYDTSGNYGWIGSGGGYTGAWFKRLLVGPSPADARFFADTYGNVVMSGLYVQSAGTPLGWIGKNPVTPSEEGAWFKKLGIGGSSLGLANIIADSNGDIWAACLKIGGGSPSYPNMTVDYAGNIWGKTIGLGGSSYANAVIKSDGSGNVTINGATLTLNLFGITTKTDNVWEAGFGSYGGFHVLLNANSGRSFVGPQDFGLFNTSGHVTMRASAEGSSSYKHGSVNVYNDGGTVTVGIGAGSPYGYGLIINGNQIVTARQTGPGNPSFSVLGDAQTWCQNLYNALRTGHGLLT